MFNKSSATSSESPPSKDPSMAHGCVKESFNQHTFYVQLFHSIDYHVIDARLPLKRFCQKIFFFPYLPVSAETKPQQPTHELLRPGKFFGFAEKV